MSGMIDYCRAATYAQTRAPVSLAATLIPEAYRCPDFYRIEQEKLWAKSWICVGYTQQLARVGDTFLARLNDQSILVTRSAPDTVRAFYNVCRHRGAEILTGSTPRSTASPTCTITTGSRATDSTTA